MSASRAPGRPASRSLPRATHGQGAADHHRDHQGHGVDGAGGERRDGHDPAGGGDDATGHDGRQHQGPAFDRGPTSATSPGQHRAGTRERGRRLEQRPGRGRGEPATDGVHHAAPGEGERRLVLPLDPGQHQRGGEQDEGRDAGGGTGDHVGPLEGEGQGAQTEQQGRRRQCGASTRGRFPGTHVVLDGVGHRLDDVVVDPRRLLVDPRETVSTPPSSTPWNVRPVSPDERAAVGGAQRVAAVRGLTVEHADRAGELGQQLGHRQRTGQRQVDPPLAGHDRDPHEAGAAGHRLRHRITSGPDSSSSSQASSSSNTMNLRLAALSSLPCAGRAAGRLRCPGHRAPSEAAASATARPHAGRGAAAATGGGLLLGGGRGVATGRPAPAGTAAPARPAEPSRCRCPAP